MYRKSSRSSFVRAQAGCSSAQKVVKKGVREGEGERKTGSVLGRASLSLALGLRLSLPLALGPVRPERVQTQPALGAHGRGLYLSTYLPLPPPCLAPSQLHQKAIANFLIGRGFTDIIFDSRRSIVREVSIRSIWWLNNLCGLHCSRCRTPSEVSWLDRSPHRPHLFISRYILLCHTSKSKSGSSDHRSLRSAIADINPFWASLSPVLLLILPSWMSSVSAGARLSHRKLT
jgi:hypothetical protein